MNSDRAAEQMKIMLEALADLEMSVVVTYPDSQPAAVPCVPMEAWRDRSVYPSGRESRIAALSKPPAPRCRDGGQFEQRHHRGSFAEDTGGQHRLAANEQAARNDVVDVLFERDAIVKAVRFVLGDPNFRRKLATCRSPYGDEHAAQRTVDVLSRLKLNAALITKWRQAPSGAFLTASNDGV